MPQPSHESMADVDPDDPDLVDRLADIVYTAVGLGVIAINRVQVARRGAQKRLSGSSNPHLASLGELLDDPERTQALIARLRAELQDIDDRLGGIEHRFLRLLDAIEPELPDTARGLTGALRDLTKNHAGQVRTALGLAS